MKKFIITISREFGCNAREVARKAAAELGVEFYDKDLVDMAAERAGISRATRFLTVRKCLTRTLTAC